MGVALDWQQPERAFGDDLRLTILLRLWRAGRSMTGRQVAHLTGSSPKGALLALDRLVAQGLVTRRTVGASFLHQLNRDHLTYPALDAAFRLLDPWSLLAERVTAAVQRLYPEGGPTVAVFGSVARGEARLDSDVDLLVVVDTVDDRAENLRSDLSAGIRAWTGQPAGIYLTTATRLASAVDNHDPIVASFRQDARTIVGPDARRYFVGSTP